MNFLHGYFLQLINNQLIMIFWGFSPIYTHIIYYINIYIIYRPHFFSAFFRIFPLFSLFYTNNTFPTHYIVPDWRRFLGQDVSLYIQRSWDIQRQSCFSPFFYSSVWASHTTDEWKIGEKGGKTRNSFFLPSRRWLLVLMPFMRFLSFSMPFYYFKKSFFSLYLLIKN